MAKKTPLYDLHLAANGKVVDFHGWLLPVNYGSQIEEHKAVRERAGMFDVSHMTILDLSGPDSEAFLRTLLVNDVAKLSAGQALYTIMLQEDGGIIDDLIVYRREQGFRVVLNAATLEADQAWIEKQAQSFGVTLQFQTNLAMLAIQGPEARDLASHYLPDGVLALKPFHFLNSEPYFIARTGYTGEDGFEVIADAETIKTLWGNLLNQTVQPCGLGARDTLRLEAGLNLYGNDMDLNHHAFNSNVSWAIAWAPETRDFIGRKACEALKASPPPEKLLGLILLDKGVLRAALDVFSNDQCIGKTTSGTFSPTLQQGIAFARIKANVGDGVTVVVRNKHLRAKVVKLPFVRRGKILVEKE